MMLCSTLIARSFQLTPHEIARTMMNARKSTDTVFFEDILDSPELSKFYDVSLVEE